jgi:lysophospholipase L1-like esterase
MLHLLIWIFRRYNALKSAYAKVVVPFMYFIIIIKRKKKNDSQSVNPLTTMDTIHKSYLALGDSYTIGEYVAPMEKFPAQIAAILREGGIALNAPDVIAVTGWTTTDLLQALAKNPPGKNYSVVSLLIGVNNQYQGKSAGDYKNEFTRLLSLAVSYAGNIKSHVFVLSIPDYGVTPFARHMNAAAIGRELDSFNLINKTIADGAGVHYLDITAISREAENDPGLIAGDGLHPSALQYKKWSELLAPLMLKELNR